MFRPILWATMAVATVFASGDFVVLHSPESVLFADKGEVDQSLLKEVFSAALGITLKQKAFWNGMNITGPFPLPEAVVGIAVEGEHLESPRGKKFTMNFDELEETTWQALSGRLEERDNDNTLRICVGDGVNALGESALGKLTPVSIERSTLKSLDDSTDEDLEILQEIELLHAIADKVRTAGTADGVSDVFWLVVPGMRPLIDLHGKDSPAVKEAFFLLNDALNDVSEAFMNAYNNNVLIAAFTNDANKVRHVRSASLVRERREDSKSTKDDSDINIKAPENPSTTPAIESIKNDEEKSEIDETTEEAKTTTSDEGSSLIKSDESHSLNEKNETRTENKEAEANEPRESSTMTSSLDLDNTTRNNEHSNTDTENTNSPLKIDDLNLAKKYSESYPVIFNIILWFGVVFFFALLAICIAIADMDPGRDSIIYRMTSNRMKKDN